jgi:thiol:disulfide interchange protein DsbD
MKKTTYLFLPVLLGMLCLPVARAMGQLESHAQVELLSNVSAIKPGQPFLLGFRFKIDPDWHIYWTNPGDSGLPTEVKLKLPAGFTAGQVQYPVPARLALPGDIINYAYEDEVMLLVQITPPKDLPIDKPVTISGKATWLVCKDDCVPGSGAISVDLPVMDTNKPDNAELFAKWISRLPVEADDADISALTAKTQGDLVTIAISWKKPVTNVQYLPAKSVSDDISEMKINGKENQTTVTFRLKSVDTIKATPLGLLSFQTNGGLPVGVKLMLPVSGR